MKTEKQVRGWEKPALIIAFIIVIVHFIFNDSIVGYVMDFPMRVAYSVFAGAIFFFGTFIVAFICCFLRGDD